MSFTDIQPEPSSYKDADGYVFYSNDKVYRKTSTAFAHKFHVLKQNGFYEKAIDTGFLTYFKEIRVDNELYLESEMIGCISYPYEWGFEQLKDAAIFQLDFLSFCLQNNCMLKDASPYNIQFVNGKPVFIDILSLEPYIENYPWNAYKQFCECFLAPLLLSAYFKGNWNRELITDIEGLALQKTASLLPLKARFNSLALFHIIAQSRVKGKIGADATIRFPKNKINSIVKHLRVGIEELKPAEENSNWSDYAKNLPYSGEEVTAKKETICNWLLGKQFNTVLDVGANNTVFTESILEQTKQLVLIDNDMTVIDILYKKNKGKPVLPLCVDISNASPAIGINLNERKSFFERVQPDVTLALAIIHHLFHSRNIPLPKIAEVFSSCSPLLIVEFISETDEMFLKIKNPNNQHPYNQELFETAFKQHFTIVNKTEIKPGKRFLYLMKRY